MKCVKKDSKAETGTINNSKKSNLIKPGNLEDDFPRLKEVDWIIEVVVENLRCKTTIFEKVDQYRKQGSIVSSNTSGISVEAMAEGRSDDFQKHFLGTHFFNPPRYLKLLEVIPTKEQIQRLLSISKHLGKMLSEKVSLWQKIRRTLLRTESEHTGYCNCK